MTTGTTSISLSCCRTYHLTIFAMYASTIRLRAASWASYVVRQVTYVCSQVSLCIRWKRIWGSGHPWHNSSEGSGIVDAPDISPPPDARSYSIKAFILVVMEAKISSIRQTSSCKWRYQSFWGILPCWFSSSPIPFIGIVGRNSASWVHLDREVELGVDWAARWRRESLLDCSKMLPRVPFVFHRVSLRASL